jgi:hypothetical protein
MRVCNAEQRRSRTYATLLVAMPDGLARELRQ